MEEILILCIGDSKLIGDSLGPLIGSFLERNKSDIGNNVKVLGTLEKPIGYNDLIEIAKHINYNKEYYTTIITIDSALGSNQNIGKILIDNTTLCAGSGVNTGEKLNGASVFEGYPVGVWAIGIRSEVNALQKGTRKNKSRKKKR